MRRLVVAGAVISDDRLLLAQRARPPHLAGLWELPGGKVEVGESTEDALVRELREELSIEVVGRGGVGDPVDLDGGFRLVAVRADLLSGSPTPTEHLAVRWVDADQLDAMCARGSMVPADTAWTPDLCALLRRGQEDDVATTDEPIRPR